MIVLNDISFEPFLEILSYIVLQFKMVTSNHLVCIFNVLKSLKVIDSQYLLLILTYNDKILTSCVILLNNDHFCVC